MTSAERPPREKRFIIEGLAWWGIIVIISSAAAGRVNDLGGLLYVFPAIAAITTIVWLHVLRNGFEDRLASGIACAVYVSCISASNYYTGGIDSHLFLLYLIPLFGALFLIQTRLQLLLVGIEQAIFASQFLTPILVYGHPPDWAVFIPRSMQLLTIGALAVAATVVFRKHVEDIEARKQETEKRERKLLTVAQLMHKLSDSGDDDATIQRTLRSAAALLRTDLSFVIQRHEGEFEERSTLCRRADGKATFASVPIAVHLPFLESVIESRSPVQLHPEEDAEAGGFAISKQFAESFCVCSMTLVPIRRGGRIFGVLGFACCTRQSFAQEDEKIASLFAAELAALLDRSLEGSKLETERALMEQMKTHALIGDLVEEFGEGASLSTVLPSVAPKIGQLLSASAGGVYILHESGTQIAESSTVNGGCRFPDAARDCPVVKAAEPFGDIANTIRCKHGPQMNRCICQPVKFGDQMLGVIQAFGSDDQPARIFDLSSQVARLLASPIQGLRSLERMDPTGFFDRLTSSYSRAFIEEQLGHVKTLAKQAEKPYCVGLFGLDNLDDINCDHGMLSGDQALRTLVESAKTELNCFHYLGRWDGGTFALVLPNTAREPGSALMAKILASAKEAIASTGIQATASAGVIASIGGEPTSRLIDDCLSRLRAARSRGGDQIWDRDI